jgi:hypothetical protein
MSAPAPVVAECTSYLNAAYAAFENGGIQGLQRELYATYLAKEDWPGPYAYCYRLAPDGVSSEAIAEPYLKPDETIADTLRDSPGGAAALETVRANWQSRFEQAEEACCGRPFQYEGSRDSVYLGEMMDETVLCSCKMTNLYDREKPTANIQAVQASLQSGGLMYPTQAVAALGVAALVCLAAFV